MEKIKVKIGILGYLPFEFDQEKIKRWKSDLFAIDEICTINITSAKCDQEGWRYSDNLLNEILPARAEEDIFIAITYVALQDNYFTRRLDDRKVVVSYFRLLEEITKNNIPIENLLLRALYQCCTVYCCEKDSRNGSRAESQLLHHDTRGCIFDHDGYISDVIYSLDKPILCSSCKEQLRQFKVSEEIINSLTVELPRIGKDSYWRMINFIKSHPLLSLAITAVSGIIINMIANYLYGLIGSLFSGKI